MSVVPEEIEWCVYVRGEADSLDPNKGAFVVEYRRGMEMFRYEEIARDEDGVYLMAENGETTRIVGAEDMFEDAGDLELVRLEVTNQNLQVIAEYDIRRSVDKAAVYGA